jgi:hypothetical protein
MAIFRYNIFVSGIAERYMDNTLNNGRIDQKNIKFPTNIFIRNFNPCTHNGGLIQLSAQKGLYIRNNPAQHLGRESNKAQGKNSTKGVGCRFNSGSSLWSLAFRVQSQESNNGAYAPIDPEINSGQVLPKQNTELTKVCVNLIREK